MTRHLVPLLFSPLLLLAARALAAFWRAACRDAQREKPQTLSGSLYRRARNHLHHDLDVSATKRASELSVLKERLRAREVRGRFARVGRVLKDTEKFRNKHPGYETFLTVQVNAVTAFPPLAEVADPPHGTGGARARPSAPGSLDAAGP